MSSASGSSSAPKASSKAHVAPKEELTPLVGAGDVEAAGKEDPKLSLKESTGEHGKSLIPGSLFKGLKEAGAILITAVGFAALLRAFWLWERSAVTVAGVWGYIALSWLATCVVMAGFQVATEGCKVATEGSKACGKMLYYYIFLGLVFLFGGILAFVALWWYHYDFALVGDGSASFGIAWGLLRSDTGNCWKRVGMALSTIVLAPITAILLGGLAVAIQGRGFGEKIHDRSLIDVDDRLSSVPSTWSAAFLSFGLTTVSVIWKVSIVEGLLLGLPLLLLAPSTSGVTLVPLCVILVKVSWLAVALLSALLVGLGWYHRVEPESALILALSAALLFGGAGVLLGDMLSPSRLEGIAVPNIIAIATNFTGGMVWTQMPPVNPLHPSMLPQEEKAQRMVFWPTLLLSEAVTGLLLMLGILILWPKVAAKLPYKFRVRLSQWRLTFVSSSAMRTLLCVCLRVQLWEALSGTRFRAGLLWEGYFTLFTGGLLWELFQSVVLVTAQPGTEWGAMSVLTAFVGGVAPFASDAFDQAKDVQFVVIALSSGNPAGEVLGLISLAYLVLYTEHTAYSPELSAELGTGYLTFWVLNPKVDAPADESGSCCPASCKELFEGAVSQALFLGYKQARPHRLEGLLVEDVVQACLSLLFLASTATAPMVVVVLNLGLPLCRLLFILFLHRCLLFQVVEKVAEEMFLAAAAGRYGAAAQWALELASGPKVSKEKLQASLTKARFSDESINVGGQSLGDGIGFLIGAALRGGSSLKGATLYRNSIGADGAKGLAEGLPHSQLEFVGLDKNSIGDDGAKALAEGLPHSQLERLYLDDNSIGDEGAKALAEALPHSQLEQLHLGWNSIGDEGAKALAKALPHSQLTELSLRDNSIGDDGAKALAEALPHSQLKKLDLYGNSIGDEGCKALREKKPEGLSISGL